jgi:hypothetical protein
MAHCNEFDRMTATARLNKKMGLCEISQRPIGKIIPIEVESRGVLRR